MGGCNWVLQTPPANLYVLVHKSGCSIKLPIIGSYLLNRLGTISTIQFPLNDLFDLVPPVNITTGSNQCYRTPDFRELCVFDLAPPVNRIQQGTQELHTWPPGTSLSIHINLMTCTTLSEVFLEITRTKIRSRTSNELSWSTFTADKLPLDKEVIFQLPLSW